MECRRAPIRSRSETGAIAENAIADRLVRAGYQILGRNVRVGRLEIDIIARKGRLIAICEVRARSSTRWMEPAESIDARKIRRVRQAAAQWLRLANLGDVDVRFDAASVVLAADGMRVAYYENAF